MHCLTCPECKREHSIFWMRYSEKKRELMYRCDAVAHTVKGQRGPELRTFTAVRMVPHDFQIDPLKAEQLPEEWAPAYRRKRQSEQQFQLVMMYGDRRGD